SRSLLCCGRISVPPAENPLARSRDTASQQPVGSRKLPAARRLATARRAKGGGAAEARASPVPNSLAMTIAPRGCHPIEVGAGAAACAPVSPRLVVELDADVASGDDGLGAAGHRQGAQHGADVDLHGALRELQFTADELVGKPLHHEAQHVDLAG